MVKKRKTKPGTVPGQLGQRTEKALKRLAALKAKYQDQGLSAAEAEKKALAELRDNGRSDWRKGTSN
jgi:hypothetical protein